MKVTVYELLGMIKDGKTPLKIKYDGTLYEFDDTKNNYYENEICSINWDYVAIYCLNDTVEILEEKEIPEKLDKYADISGDLALEWSGSEKKLKDKIDEIIDYLESKGE